MLICEVTRNDIDGNSNCWYGNWRVILLIELGTAEMEGDA